MTPSYRLQSFKVGMDTNTGELYFATTAVLYFCMNKTIEITQIYITCLHGMILAVDMSILPVFMIPEILGPVISALTEEFI